MRVNDTFRPGIAFKRNQYLQSLQASAVQHTCFNESPEICQFNMQQQNGKNGSGARPIQQLNVAMSCKARHIPTPLAASSHTSCCSSHTDTSCLSPPGHLSTAPQVATVLQLVVQHADLDSLTVIRLLSVSSAVRAALQQGTGRLWLGQRHNPNKQTTQLWPASIRSRRLAHGCQHTAAWSQI